MPSPSHSQLVQECNASVQSMKRTEELIHLSKKIHFEGKVREGNPASGVGGRESLPMASFLCSQHPPLYLPSLLSTCLSRSSR